MQNGEAMQMEAEMQMEVMGKIEGEMQHHH